MPERSETTDLYRVMSKAAAQDPASIKTLRYVHSEGFALSWLKPQRTARTFTLTSWAMQRIILMLCVSDSVAVGSTMHEKNIHTELGLHANIPNTEMDALFDLYNTTNGENWSWSRNVSDGIPWNFTNPSLNNPCADNWQGIRCSFSIPFEYYHVTRVHLPSCNLSGHLPDSISSLTQLQQFTLELNQLTGTLPETVGKLTQLQELYLESNQLTGTIPALLGCLNQLLIFSLYDNFLTGTIPESLGNFTQLQYFILGRNHLTGTIPESLGNLVHVRSIDLDTNQLRGSIPGSFGQLSEITYMYIELNQLEGTLPASLGNLIKLQDLDIDNNQLTGPIPESLGNLTRLHQLYMDTNQLTGTIPEAMGNLTLLQTLYLYLNQLTGTLPSSLGNIVNLQYMLMHSNLLSGTIPDLLNTGLLELQLQHNRIEGKVPSLSSLPQLQVVLLQNNGLTGNLDDVFDPITQLQIETIVLNNNQLTGTLPAAIFQLKLVTFVGSSNCFKGPLPIEPICNNFNMVSFVVDGMSSASSCRNKLFISAYALQHAIGGKIDICLFKLPNITTLHLSGNEFTGSIQSSITISNTLTDLSVSHNALTGSIPEQIQMKRWTNIDLSYNRLSGTLLSNFASNGTVALDNNRLSGDIPKSFDTLSNISVLGSNAFSCLIDQSDLPQRDTGRKRYHCGSNSFDILFYLWLGITACSVILFIFPVYKYLASLEQNNCIKQTDLYITLSAVCESSLHCAFYAVAILLPLYAICNVYHGTQTYKYAYQVSAVFMSGVAPFALDWCFWIILLVTVMIKVLLPSKAISNNGHTMNPQEQHFSWKTALFVFTPYLLIDLFVVVGVNSAYVYVAVYRGSSLLLVVQTLVSIFKVVWGRWTLPYILAALTGQRKYGKVQVIAQIVVNILNNIVIPCAVVAVISPNCFYNALVPAPAVSTTVNYQDCVVSRIIVNKCMDYSDVSLPTSFDPPFTYNYQCSSSLVTYYSPAFVSMCIVSTFVTPLTQYTCQWLHRRAKADTYWYWLLNKSLPVIMKPIDIKADTPERGYLSSGGLITSLVGTLGLILTFGVMFPPLCIALAVSVLVSVFAFKVDVSRFISSATYEYKDKVVEMLRAECNGFDSMRVLTESVWVLVTVSCWFYTLFLFDILGDAVGFGGAYWVLIVMPIMPLVLYIVYSVVCKLCTHLPRPDIGLLIKRNIDVEMQTLSSADAVHNILVVSDTVGDCPVASVGHV